MDMCACVYDATRPTAGAVSRVSSILAKTPTVRGCLFSLVLLMSGNTIEHAWKFAVYYDINTDGTPPTAYENSL